MFKFIIVAVLSLASTGAFAQYYGYNSEPRQISSQQFGVQNALRSGEAVEVEVVSVRNVRIQQQASGTRQAAFAAVGGGLGGLAGSNMGQGKGKTAATALGGLFGALAGASMATPSPVQAQELAIRKVGGTKMVVLVQAESNFRVGERGLFTQVGDEMRVSRMYADEPIERNPSVQTVPQAQYEQSGSYQSPSNL